MNEAKIRKNMRKTLIEIFNSLDETRHYKFSDVTLQTAITMVEIYKALFPESE